MKNISTSTLRFLLVVLFSTFMSPGFAWHMIDSHNGMPHASALADADNHAHEVHHPHDADSDKDGNAHDNIGHLLSHLPVVTHDIASLPALQACSAVYPMSSHAFVHATVEPPFKPPRNPLFA
ncbi:MAG: hypothetical protein Q7U37_07710 [Gallionella sp.]|nr:hypothetical protein [Gallionella sp.]